MDITHSHPQPAGQLRSLLEWSFALLAALLVALLLIVRPWGGKTLETSFQPVVSSPVAEAAMTGDLAALERAIPVGGLDMPGADGLTPLMVAVQEGHLPVVDRLLAAGVAVNHRNQWGQSALILAAQWDNPELVTRLLTAGADPNARTDKGRTALMRAAQYGHAEVLERLLAAGADPQAVDHRGEDALFYAVRHGQTALLPRLLTLGLEVNRVNLKGANPLQVAVTRGDQTTADLLIAHGATLPEESSASQP
ncbi:MAG: ankyrin repeat domain-containing protein [Magnetococcales bacterium]|nr:ankyrin repeat domain-containing protein [Magnetococcales bacterium]